MHLIQIITIVLFVFFSALVFFLSIWHRKRVTLGCIETTVIPLVIGLVGLSFVSSFYFTDRPEILFIGLVIYILGSALGKIAFMHLSYANSDDFWLGRKKKKKRTLIMTGPYARIRHPIAVQFMISYLGLIIVFLHPVTIGLYVILLIIVIYTSFQEEKFMQSIFPEYKDYMKRTGRFIPKLWKRNL